MTNKNEEPKINEDILNYFLSRHQTIINASETSAEIETEAEANLIKPQIEPVNNSIVLSLPAFTLSVSSNSLKMPDVYSWFQLIHHNFVKPIFKNSNKKSYLG